MTHKRTTLVLIALTLAGLTAGCGDSGPDADSADATAPSAETDQPEQPDMGPFAQCMRDQGIAGFPDSGPDGIDIRSSGIDPQAPEYVAAEEACSHLLPLGFDPVPPDGAAGTGANGWTNIVPDGECMCADGSEFSFWDRPADPTKVVLYLEGGGICTDATTCAFTGNGESEIYKWALTTNNPAGNGIFAFDRADNPFADHSFVYVPMCTGDLYLGNATHEYAPDVTVEHKGSVNTAAALSYLAEHYPAATELVVVGETAGGATAALYAGLAADLLPDAQITVLAAEAGHIPDDADFNERILTGLYDAFANMPTWPVNDGLTADQWGVPRFTIQAGLHDPDIVMARFDYAYDANAMRALELLGVDASTLEMIDANETAIEAAGVDQHSYTAAGNDHGIIEFDAFYEVEVDGVRLVDWLSALLSGNPLPDVHCTQCETG